MSLNTSVNKTHSLYCIIMLIYYGFNGSIKMVHIYLLKSYIV